MAGLFFSGIGLWIELPPLLCFISRHNGPADLLSLSQDAGLNSLMLIE